MVVGEETGVAGDLRSGIGVGGGLGNFQTAGRSGEAEMEGVRIAIQDYPPFAPRGTVTFVDDDDIEIVFWVVLDEE